MRFRLGGCAVALVLALSACGVDTASEDVAPDPAEDASSAIADLASARDTLPPAPHTATALTVLLTHDGAADDPGLDAAAAALAQRPDIAVVVAVAAGAGDTTMSGFPVVEVHGTTATFVADAARAAGIDPDLVVVGIEEVTEAGLAHALARSALDADVPALVVGAERADQVDHAAAALQLLEVLDLRLDVLLDEPAGIHRLTVPSCGQGSLRGRVEVRAAISGAALGPSWCTSVDRTPPVDELDAVAAGYASLAQIR